MAVKVIVEGNLGDEFAFNQEAKKVELKVDGTTVKKKPDGTVYAVQGAGAGSVEIEEVTGITNYYDGWGNTVDAPFQLSKDGTTYPITKVGRIKGTDWLVLQASGLFVQPQPPEQPPESEQPPSDTPIATYLEYACVDITDAGGYYEMSNPISVHVTTSDTVGKTPQTVKFDVTLGSQTRTYSYPYSSGNVYNWNSIGDFDYEGTTSYSIGNARVEFTDGSLSLPPTIIHPSCTMGSLPE